MDIDWSVILGEYFANCDDSLSDATWVDGPVPAHIAEGWKSGDGNLQYLDNAHPPAMELVAGIAEAAKDGRITAWHGNVADHHFDPFQENGSWVTCCPAHDDHNPSFVATDVIDEDGRRKLLIKCRAGCAQEALIAVLNDDLGLWNCPLGTIEVPAKMSETITGTGSGHEGNRYTTNIPVPANASPPADHHRDLGPVKKRWLYRNSNGELVFCVCRFEPNPIWERNFASARVNGRKLEKPNHKTFRPQSHCRCEDGTERWCWVAPTSDIPLYGADKLAAQPASKVIICEGEKAADAAQVLFPERVSVAWYGGAQAVAKAPWHVLALRDVLIWPDPDTAGSRAAQAIVDQLQAAGCGSIAMLDVKGLASLDPSNPDGPSRETPEKWDAADALAEWGDVARLKAEIDRNSRLLARGPILPDRDSANAIGTGVTIDHFYAYMPRHEYIFRPTGELWPAASVNSLCPPVIDEEKKKLASQWLDQYRAVVQMTWAPGEPQLIADRLVSDGGWILHIGANCYNLYRSPISQPEGDPSKAGPWVDHIDKVFPRDRDHIVSYLAHRVQRPQEKINHSLVLGGDQGIGKDTILEPVKPAVGPWNFAEVSPRQMLGRFNGFLKSVILRVNEARDLGEFDRFQFYDHVKNYMASPPDVLRVDEKNLREHNVLNCCAVIITTNHKTDGIYLPPDDRRHYVAWSDCTKDDFEPEYWRRLWNWYEEGGYAHVAAYLAQLDISQFDPKAPPLKTPAFWTIADANRAPENAELADVIDRLRNPDALTLNQIKTAGIGTGVDDWINDRKIRRIIPHRLESCGYAPVRNDTAKDGLWKVGGTRMTIYAKKLLSEQERLRAATALTR